MHLTREAFVLKYFPFVKRITAGTGIFPEIMLAQAILESQGAVDGYMYPGASKLADQYNNYFGIKAGSAWKGPKVNLKTGEVINNKNVTITDAFRVYQTPEESFRDYVKFLKENPRYKTAGVFEAESYADQALRLQAAGYATATKYAEVVTQIASRVRDYISKGGTSNGWGDMRIYIAAGILFFLTNNIIK